jgi:cell wall-associated NlpC family hydrolase
VTPNPTQVSGLTAIKQAAKANGLAWQPLAAIAHHESNLNPGAVGDQGTSFGLFQLHQGGALPAGTPTTQATNPMWNASFAARAIKALNIQNLPYAQQTYQISKRFERPTDVAGETRDANDYLRALGGLQSAAPAATGAAPQPTLQTARQPGTQNPLSALSLGALQTSFDTQRQANQRSLDALGKLSGHQVQAAAGPDLTSLIQQAQTSEASGATQAKPQHVHVDLKGETPTHLGSVAQKAIELSKHFLGSAYVYGGASPKTGFDCSGLLQYVWAQNGVKIPRTAAEQYHAGKPVAPNALQPGDALYFQTEGVNGGVTHAAMYLGDGQLIESPHTGDVVKIAPLAGYYQQHLVGARRFA